MGDMVISAFFFAFMAAAIKNLGRHISLQEIIFFRGVGCALMTYWWVRRQGIAPMGSRPGLLAARGALGHLALSCYAWSLANQPLAEAILLQQISPVFTAVLAYWFLKEPPGRRFLPAFALTILGVALLVRPGTATTVLRHPWAIPVALTGAVLGAGAYVAVRDAVRTEHPMRIVLWFPLVSVPLSIPGVVIEGPVVPHGWDWAWLGLVALSAQFGQVFLTRGLSRVPAGRATLANPLTTAFGALLGWVAFQEPLGWSTLAGGAALVTAILLASSGRRTTVQDVPVAPVSSA